MRTGTKASAPPARGARPRTGRALLIPASRELCYRHGCANVAMSDIATPVGIGHLAPYRQFGGRQEMLNAVVAERPFTRA